MALSIREQERIIQDLIQQGCTTRETKKGTIVYFPDGVSMLTLHRSSPSDQRAEKNMRSIVLRAGLEWPPDRKARLR